eukprot:13733952-Alexandrium_andersonii.AAC.1
MPPRAVCLKHGRDDPLWDARALQRRPMVSEQNVVKGHPPIQGGAAERLANSRRPPSALRTLARRRAAPRGHPLREDLRAAGGPDAVERGRQPRWAPREGAGGIAADLRQREALRAAQ